MCILGRAAVEVVTGNEGKVMIVTGIGIEIGNVTGVTVTAIVAGAVAGTGIGGVAVAAAGSATEVGGKGRSHETGCSSEWEVHPEDLVDVD